MYPSASVQASFTSRKYPSRFAVQSMSRERSKKRLLRTSAARRRATSQEVSTLATVSAIAVSSQRLKSA